MRLQAEDRELAKESHDFEALLRACAVDFPQYVVAWRAD